DCGTAAPPATASTRSPASCSPPGGSRSSTSRAATSRSQTKTAPSVSSRTARSTTIRSCGSRRCRRAMRCARAATRRSTCISTRSRGPATSSGCAGCSRSRSGTRARGGSCSRAIASELKALLELPDVSRELDPDALEAYFDGGYVPAPLTIFRDARKLGQGELLLWDEGSPVPTVERYARPLPEPPRSESDEELAEELRRLLRDAVRAHLLSDVPVGVLLSGGVDSSALTALASELADEPVHTFSIGFEERSYDELGKARLVAQRFGTEHHELRL